MEEEQKYNRGSEWRKWDLHVHSPKVFLNNQFGTTSVDDFVNKISDSGIVAVGLTNYFRFDDSELGEVKDKLNKKGIVVFPNIEFRTQPPNKENEEMHVHVLFSDTVSTQKITNFLGRLKTVDQKYCKDLTTQDIETTSITIDALREKLAEDEDIKYLQDYLIIACPRGQGNFRPSKNDDGRGNNFAIVVDKYSDILFGNADDTEFFLKTDRYKNAKTKPVLLCSDTHKLDDIGAKFTWVKADTTFEGLKQTLYEPKERVLIQERNPSDSKTKRLIIDRTIYKTSSGEEKTVYFNGDLNSIIGKRGSGKSTLLKNLAQKIDPNEFSKRDKKVPYALSDFEVVWGDEQKNEGTEESPKSIFYIPQGYLSALAYDDGERANERDVFLTQLLKKNERFANAIQSFENFVSKNKVYIEELIQKLLTANATIKENATSLKKQGAKAEIEAEIKKKNEQIKKYKGTGITDKEVKDYSEAKKVVENSKGSIDTLNQDKDILTAMKKTGASVFVSDQEFSLLSSARQELIQKELQKKSKENLKTLIDKELVEIDTQIKTLEKAVADKEKVIKKLEEKIKKSKALEDLTKELTALEKTIDAIKKLSDNLEKSKKEKTETINALVDAYGNFETQQTSIYKTIKFEEKFSFLKVKVVARYNTQQLKTFVERNINTRDSDQSVKSEKDIKELFGDNPKQISVDTIKKLITGIVDGKIIAKVEAGDVGAVLAQLLKNRFEIDYLNSVKTINGRTHFKDMTGGQKAIALLELIFRFDDEKYPILIDQPEDDLDVGGIASDLVNFITSEKQDRQIIIVTHNASLVICADTENVIVSNIKSAGSSKYDFSYAIGSIENPDRRSDIIEVLEGGESALKKRMLKLNIR